jgi:hypothetical protein
MRHLIKIINLLFFLFSLFTSFAQQKQQELNRIILWDVTASMVGSTPNGYNQFTDIDKNVRQGLRNLINSFEDDNSTFRILPFTTDIIDFKKVFTANASGKSQALNYIDSYVISPQIKGYTNICAAWEKANSYIDKGKSNFIYLYTDGEQNINYGQDGTNCLQALVNKYCELTKGSSFTYFVSINANNKVSFPADCGTVLDVKGNTVIKTPKLLNLTPLSNTLFFNLQDGLSQIIRLRENGNRKVGASFKPLGKLTFSNSQYSLDVELSVKQENVNNTVDFELKLIDFSNTTINRMKRVAGLNESAILTLESTDPEIKFEPAQVAVIFKYEAPKPVQKVTIKIDN